VVFIFTTVMARPPVTYTLTLKPLA
jgi:hypothetical protein